MSTSSPLKLGGALTSVTERLQYFSFGSEQSASEARQKVEADWRDDEAWTDFADVRAMPILGTWAEGAMITLHGFRTVDVELSAEDSSEIESAFSCVRVKGARLPEQVLPMSNR